MDNLTNIEYKYLDIVLSKYKYLPSRIARRKLEIETFHTTDANIGGGKSNIVTKRTEWLIERFDSDVKLKGLECQQRAVEATIELLDDTMKRVFELRWIDGYTPQEIAELTNSSVKNTQKRLERIMEIFADYWGWTWWTRRESWKSLSNRWTNWGLTICNWGWKQKSQDTHCPD